MSEENEELTTADLQSEEKPKKGLVALIVQFFKFGIVGLINTGVSFAVNMLSLMFFYKVLGIPEDNKISYWTSSILAFIISVLNAYILSNKFVFKNKEGEERVWWKVLIKTYISYAGTGLILNNILLWMWNDVIHVGQYFGWLADIINNMGISMTGDRLVSYIAQFLNMAITIPLNFIMNKFWAYRGKKKEVQE